MFSTERGGREMAWQRRWKWEILWQIEGNLKKVSNTGGVTRLLYWLDVHVCIMLWVTGQDLHVSTSLVLDDANSGMIKFQIKVKITWTFFSFFLPSTLGSFSILQTSMVILIALRKPKNTNEWVKFFCILFLLFRYWYVQKLCCSWTR